MSHQLISRNPDLQRLRDEGYEIEVRSNLLLVHSVPYVNSLREVALGTIVSELTTASPGVLDKPGTHQVHFIGEHPCHPDGRELGQIKNASGDYPLADGVTASHYFSNKPRLGSTWTITKKSPTTFASFRIRRVRLTQKPTPERSRL